MKIVEEIDAHGHRNITAKNKKTFEITMDDDLTPYGDCIVAVRASKAARGLGDAFKLLAKRKDARIKVILEVDGLVEEVSGFGDPDLEFDNETDFVVRKSSYICGRTLMIRADKAASDLSRSLIRRLKSSKQRVNVKIIVEI